MKITHIRKVAIIYPYLSLEAKVKDEENTYYINIAVNDRKEPIEPEKNPLYDWWAYDIPLDELAAENNIDEHYLGSCDFGPILDQMVEYWNNDPVFKDNLLWKPFKAVSNR